MFNSKIWFPIPFEGVDTYLTIAGHIWVKYFSQEES